MVQFARYVPLYEDEQRESHFEDVDVALTPVDFAPPAAPLNVASLFGTAQCSLVGAPAGWQGETFHPSPRRQVFCQLQGEYHVTASDGTTRRFPAGSMLLLEDTRGKGHSTHVVSDEDVLILAIALAV